MSPSISKIWSYFYFMHKSKGWHKNGQNDPKMARNYPKMAQIPRQNSEILMKNWEKLPKKWPEMHANGEKTNFLPNI